jgi:ankyrin repeat protein
VSRQNILAAIDDDDHVRVKKLIWKDPSLAIFAIPEAKLYRSKIFHWIYVGDTPLHLAAAGYRVEIVQLLLAAGADPNSHANHRQSGPLHYAEDTCTISPAWSGRKQVRTLGILGNGGARINAQDKNGATPLHRAVRTRGAEAVKFLLKAGSDPLLKNKPGSTPFHLAVQNTGRGGSGTDDAKAEQKEIIQAFLSSGLKPTLKDINGKSVLDWAKSDWIRDLLRD